MANQINIFWFKRDLRIYDNDALSAALKENLPLLLVYIYEPSLINNEHYSDRHWRFINESISNLNEQLVNYNTEILVIHDETTSAFYSISQKFKIKNIFSTEETGLDLTFKRDIKVASYCKEKSITWIEFRNGGVIRGLSNRNTWREAWYAYMDTPITPLNLKKKDFVNSEDFAKLGTVLPSHLRYSSNHSMQIGGRDEGHKWMASFFEERLKFFSEYISKPEMARYGCSRLSPYIAWGCLSIREIYQRGVKVKITTTHKKQLNAFMSRIRWQSHFIQKFEMEPRIEFEAFNKGYIDYPQPVNTEFVKAWKAGKTGYPLVDASLRAVVETGYLNFRMRSMCVSFLVHHLFQHFSTGAEWLARQFLDFEPGIHYGQFQMQSGFTATNTIRIYSPTKNALDHDPEALFIKKYVPELRNLPNAFALEPWKLTAMEELLYDFKLGDNYPNRIVDTSATRAYALKRLYDKRKDELTKLEKNRILKVHTLKKRFP